MDSTAPAEPPPLHMPRQLPGFSKAMAIVDLAMSASRGMAGLLGIVGLAVVLKSDENIGSDKLYTALLFSDVILAIVIGILGITTGILLILKKKSSIPLAWVVVFLTAIHIGVTVGATLKQLEFQQVASGEGGMPFFIGAVVGGGLTILIRCGLLVAYFIGIKKASYWFREQQP